MNSETQLWLFAMSVGASALGGMLGMASGIFIVPILTILATSISEAPSAPASSLSLPVRAAALLLF